MQVPNPKLKLDTTTPLTHMYTHTHTRAPTEHTQLWPVLYSWSHNATCNLEPALYSVGLAATALSALTNGSASVSPASPVLSLQLPAGGACAAAGVVNTARRARGLDRDPDDAGDAPDGAPCPRGERGDAPQSGRRGGCAPLDSELPTLPGEASPA